MPPSTTIVLRTLGIGALLSLPGLAQVQPSPPPEPQKIEITNGARVYFPAVLATGDTVTKVSVATVRATKIFEAIPEYQEIKRRDLDPNSAEYLLYLRKASDRFQDAIGRTVAKGRYELVAELGAISTKTPVIDITAEVIKNL